MLYFVCWMDGHALERDLIDFLKCTVENNTVNAF